MLNISLKKTMISLISLVVMLTFCLVSSNNNILKVKAKNFNSSARIGISVPKQNSTLPKNWTTSLEQMKDIFELKGFEVDLNYSSDVFMQIGNIENMLLNGITALIITPINKNALKPIVETAKSEGIIVVSLLEPIDQIDYFVSFDPTSIVTLFAEFFEGIFIPIEPSDPISIEMIIGDTNDYKTRLFYDEMMRFLSPYIESGTVVFESGRMDMELISVPDLSPEMAQVYMERLLSDINLTDELNIIFCEIDAIAQGVIEACLASGFNSQNFPLILGQNCELRSVKDIIEGRQAMSIFNNVELLVEPVCNAVEQLINGATPDYNQIIPDDSGNEIHANLVKPIAVDIHNYRAELIISGYYTEEELGLPHTHNFVITGTKENHYNLCSICQKTEVILGNHFKTILSFNSTEHYARCDCSFEYAENHRLYTEGFKQKCTECSYEYVMPHNHVYTYPSYDNLQHLRTCSCGLREWKNHVFMIHPDGYRVCVCGYRS